MERTELNKTLYFGSQKSIKYGVMNMVVGHITSERKTMNVPNLAKIQQTLNLKKHEKTTTLFISLLLLLSTISVLNVVTVQAATTTYTFGNTSIGSTSNWIATDRDASRFQLTQSGRNSEHECILLQHWFLR